MLFQILENRLKLVVVLICIYLISWKFQVLVILPLEQSLGFEITQHASFIFFPAGVIFISFYLLRWWFLPVVLIGRVFTGFEHAGSEFSLMLFVENGIVVCVYPLWLYILNLAKWDVFGDRDESNLTIIGAMIFQLLVTFTISLAGVMREVSINAISWDQSTQYIVHFISGDVLGAGIVMYLFYRLMKLARPKRRSC